MWSVPHAGGIACHGGTSTVFIGGGDRVRGGDPSNVTSCGRLLLILQDLLQLTLQLGLIHVGSTSGGTWPDGRPDGGGSRRATARG